MKFDLKDFQNLCARNVPDELDEARVAAAKGKPQAIVLSAPTGSGKTITVAAVIDWTFGGWEGIPARPNTTFLWLSDSPEINQLSGPAGGEKPFYPDFVIVRRQGTGYVVDILEPHDDTRLDTSAKVKGLAKFADEHGMSFGRLMVGRKAGGSLQVVDVSEHGIREKARKMGAPADLEALFAEL